MSIANEYVVCLTKYGLAAIGFTMAIIVLASLMLTTPWRAIIATIIPSAVAALAIATKRLRPRDCAATVVLLTGYFYAATAYMAVFAKIGVPAGYFYYTMFIVVTLAYVAAVAPIAC
jgi:uncharacterized membrane protein YhaH (DUF805 family)